MRPNLHLIAEHRSRRNRAARRADHGRPRAREDLLGPDAALQRVRESGGPLDHASYVCQCGYVFEADVSTTVACPHCSAPQAW